MTPKALRDLGRSVRRILWGMAEEEGFEPPRPFRA
jgi:hypothetical protein